MEIKKIEQASLKMEITTKILNNLPNWFGIPSSITEYVNESSTMPYWAAYEGKEVIGFIAVKQNSRYTYEIYVMGIEEEHHRKGVGRELFQTCYRFCQKNKAEFLQVKTLDSTNPDPYYVKTREFYEALGFRPLECVKELWDEWNPCLIMIMHVE